MEGGPRMGGGKSVGSTGSGCAGAAGLGTEGFLVVAGRLVGFFGRTLWVNTAPIRRNSANAETSPAPAFIVLWQKMIRATTLCTVTERKKQSHITQAIILAIYD